MCFGFRFGNDLENLQGCDLCLAAESAAVDDGLNAFQIPVFMRMLMTVFMFMVVMVSVLAGAMKIFHIMIMIFMGFVQDDIKIAGINAGFIDPGYFYFIAFKIQAI